MKTKRNIDNRNRPTEDPDIKVIHDKNVIIIFFKIIYVACILFLLDRDALDHYMRKENEFQSFYSHYIFLYFFEANHILK